MKMISALIFCAALGGCGSVGSDANYLATDYQAIDAADSVQVESADGPQTLKVRLNHSRTKILVLLDSGALSRALAKDFGTKNNALPKSVFEDAANKQLTTLGPNCHTTTALQRQDYMWEFDFSCDAVNPAPPMHRRRG